MVCTNWPVCYPLVVNIPLTEHNKRESCIVIGVWFGIELDKPVGKNDGSVNGRRYFTCKPNFGVFAPPSRVQK